MTQKQLIQNPAGEDLYVQIEGPEDADVIIVYVHGFGSHMNEGYALEFVKAFFDKYRIVRFDFSSCGQSVGKQEDICFKKMKDDLKVVLDYVDKEFEGSIGIVAHSMGAFVVSLLSPDGIDKSVFTGVPNADTWHLASQLQNRILKRLGGTVDEIGISSYPRNDGTIQKLGPCFWRDLKEFEPVKMFSEYANKTKLYVIHPLQDEVVGEQFIEDYKKIEKAEFVELPGNHNFTKPEDRKQLILKIKEFFEN
ncbi:MAG: alpha/beta hydrolase [Parcubacteria group bacterium]